MPAALPITVIIPAFNAAATIGDALASVAAQSRPPAQTLVVDDGSTDATARLARAHGAQVLSLRNGGVGAARNAGIVASTLPWIALLDADDRWHPRRLEAQWSLHERRPDVPLLTTDYALFVDGGVEGRAVLQTLRRYRAMPRTRLGGGRFVPRRALLGAVLRGNFVLPSTLLVDRRIFSQYGVYFAERDRLPSGPDFFIGEDIEWLVRVLAHSDALVVEEPLVGYRRHPASLSASGGRLRYGDVKLGEFVCAHPERYEPAVCAGFRRFRPRHLREAGLRFLVVGEVVRARALFAQSLHARAGPRSLGLLAATAPLATPVGERWLARALVAWRERVGPALRPLRRRA